MENIAGIVLTGGLRPDEVVWKLIRGMDHRLPILGVKEDTFPTTQAVAQVRGMIDPQDHQKTTRVLAVFEKHVDVERLSEMLIRTCTSMVTPKMFEYELLRRAKANKQHIVLPEGEEERILRAAEDLLCREVVDITLLGDEEVIRERRLDVSDWVAPLREVTIIDPLKSDLLDHYCSDLFRPQEAPGDGDGRRLRQHERAKLFRYDDGSHGACRRHGLRRCPLDGGHHSARL